MRPTCTFCARKHVAQAIILLSESEQGYPEHRWLAMGHLAEASDELVKDYPKLANLVRTQRKFLEEGKKPELPLMELITAIGKADAHESGQIGYGKMVSNPPFHGPIVGASQAAETKHVPGIAEAIGQIGKELWPSTTAPVEHLSTTTPQPGTELAPTTPAVPCTPCERSRRYKERSARWSNENKQEPAPFRLIIVTAIGSWDPAYSLVSVILDQARAATLLPGVKVLIFVQEGCPHPGATILPDSVEVVDCVPRLSWANDKATDENHAELNVALHSYLGAAISSLRPDDCAVITHDLVFQSSFCSFARVFHELANARADLLLACPFYHMLHSSVGPRAVAEKNTPIWYRTNVPPGHTMVSLNHADLLPLTRYYDAPLERFVVIENSRDVRLFLGMTDAAATLVSKHQLHLATYLQVFPLSGPRMMAKGVQHVVSIFKALLELSIDPGATPAYDTGTVRLVIADAHANGSDGKQQRIVLREFARRIGLPDECLVFVSESLGESDHRIRAQGLDHASIRSLLQLANVFIFPTSSESGSLVLMEAAMAGNLLVLNESLPCLADYVKRPDALWVPFGSAKVPEQPWAASDVADQIESALATSMTARSKHAVIAQSCLEAYAERLRAVLGIRSAAEYDQVPLGGNERA